MRRFTEGVTVAAVLLAVLWVLVGIGFLLWIVAARNPASLLTRIETLALAVCVSALLLWAWYPDD